MRRTLAALAIGLLFLPAVANADLTTSLQGCWNFDESSGNAADVSGNSNTLTNVNTVTYGTGKINNAAIFTAASTNYLTINDNASLSFTGDFSAAGWINFTSLPGSGGDYALFAKFDPTGNQRSYRVYLDNSAGTFTLHAAISNTGSSATDKSVGWTPSTATWYYVAIVYTASAGKVQFYVNGAQQGTDQTGYPTSILDGTAPFRFGDGQTGGGIWLDGKLDAWAVWSKALTSTDVTTGYASGAGFACPFTVVAAPKSFGRVTFFGWF